MKLSAAHRLRRPLVALAATALLWAPLGFRPAAAADTYEIDAILSLTGPFAFLGTAEAASLRTLEPLINKNGGIDGRPVHFNIQDDSSQPPVAVQLANGIIAKHVAVMLGPTYSASCLAVAPLVRANGPVQYCFAPTIHPPAGSYTFSGGASSLDQAIETLTFAKAKGWKRLAYIATTDATGQDIEEQFKSAIGLARFSDMHLVLGEHFNGNDVSIAAQLSNIKAANPDAILAMTVGATGTLLRSLKDAGVDGIPMISNLGNLINAALAQYAPNMPSQMYFTAPRFYAHDVSGRGPVRDAQTAFFKAFNAAGIDPDVGNNFPWDPTLIVISGLRKLGANADAKSLLAFVENVHDFAGTNGIYNYTGGDQRGQGLSDLVMVRWDPAKKRVVTVSEPGGKPLP
jgi:branched-chain amino acid transport system substrate-binding protein